MNLVIVESPAKAKTINKYLGSDYIVLASYGHVRDLPSKNGSVDTEHDFKMIWEIDPGSKKHLKEITDCAINMAQPGPGLAPELLDGRLTRLCS